MYFLNITDFTQFSLLLYSMFVIFSNIRFNMFCFSFHFIFVHFCSVHFTCFFSFHFIYYFHLILHEFFFALALLSICYNLHVNENVKMKHILTF